MATNRTNNPVTWDGDKGKFVEVTEVKAVPRDTGYTYRQGKYLLELNAFDNPDMPWAIREFESDQVVIRVKTMELAFALTKWIEARLEEDPREQR